MSGKDEEGGEGIKEEGGGEEKAAHLGENPEGGGEKAEAWGGEEGRVREVKGQEDGVPEEILDGGRVC